MRTLLLAKLSNLLGRRQPVCFPNLHYSKLEYGRYDPGTEKFQSCTENQASHVRINIPASAVRKMTARFGTERTELEKLGDECEFLHYGREVRAIIGYKNGEFLSLPKKIAFSALRF